MRIIGKQLEEDLKQALRNYEQALEKNHELLAAKDTLIGLLEGRVRVAEANERHARDEASKADQRTAAILRLLKVAGSKMKPDQLASIREACEQEDLSDAVATVDQTVVERDAAWLKRMRIKM
ncbi:MAG TPA: hypothetical protein VNY29_12155 [Terriglobales bacterium]|jgi:hypothetical protein|nr:hypothetical protein [Terriglobales bacterium]